MQDVGREGCGAGGDGLIWELCTLPLFCCEHKSTLKNNILIREREREREMCGAKRKTQATPGRRVSSVF